MTFQANFLSLLACIGFGSGWSLNIRKSMMARLIINISFSAGSAQELEMFIALPTLLSDGEPTRSSLFMSATQCVDTVGIRAGLCRREFRAYAQPKFDLHSRVVHSVEVLARWQHPQYGLLPPAAFIATMTREQLLDDLFSELLEQSLACQIRLHRQGWELGFSLNLSLHQLATHALFDRLITRLMQHPLPLSSVTLEITEDAPAVLAPDIRQRLMCLKTIGVRLSMDDFGTGYSSLWRLSEIPFEELKLAGEFTRQLEGSPRARTIVRNALTLAEDLQMELIVEGIETQEQRSLLLELGANHGQGYFCAKPMSMESLVIWLKRLQRS
ncbi:EAL domain-containing protein [Pseudomonas wayambapalatensis]|nr:EAL domain-containing protein [Pseudomonas wayambapalatensis]